MSSEIIKVPDIGGSTDVEIIEIAVSEGDTIDAEDTLITLESDKASMDVPSPKAGKVVKVLVKVGDTVSEGDDIVELEAEGGGEAPAEASSTPAPGSSESAESAEEKPAATSSGSGGGADDAAPTQESAAPAADAAPAEEDASNGEPERKEIRVPDLSGSSDVPIIEVGVSVGDELEEEDPLITLESDKASMDVPSPYKGKLLELTVKEGDTVSEGDLIGYMEVAGTSVAGSAKPKPAAESKAQKAQAPAAKPDKPAETPAGAPSPEAQMAAHKPRDGKLVHAGPAVRMLARELGVDLGLVKPSGPKERVLKEDVHAYVKQVMAGKASTPAAAPSAASGGGIPPIPDQDFSEFGEVEERPIGRLMKMGATNLHRSWVNLPHVTQFDEADITELEAFRKSMKAEAEAQGAKLTPLPFLVKACAYALQQYPQFNISLKADGVTLVQKKYVHIGIAVDTPDGLMVPVIRDVDKKSLIDIAKESVELAKKAQTKKLKREEMTGGCFTISSLGSIGGTAFTPIINAPEVAILGISKAQMKPVWDGKAFEPRLMMPLCLSFDHRAVNGADGARFTALLSQLLSDIRRLLL